MDAHCPVEGCYRGRHLARDADTSFPFVVRARFCPASGAATTGAVGQAMFRTGRSLDTLT
jgi:hypothetical protein